ncbi:MAG: hypothetical protein JJU13_10345 [Balneolaceae bacterium]|nr:hypothetical protein [Balneolaceae bacterium]
MTEALNEFEEQHPEVIKEIRQLARLADPAGFEAEYLRSFRRYHPIRPHTTNEAAPIPR